MRLEPRAGSSRAGGGSGTCRRRGRPSAARRPSAQRVGGAGARRSRGRRRRSPRAAGRREVDVTTAATSAAPSPKRHAYGAAGVVARELLELDGGLALVRHLVAHAEDGGDRVEEPAHARRERRVDAQALRAPAASAPTARPGRPARGATAATRHGSRIAASPPGSGTGSRWASRSKRGEVAAQELAAPERAVRRRSRCRRRRARAPAPARRARPGRPRRGRGGAGRRRLGVLLERPLRRQVLGVQVVRDRARGATPSIVSRARGRRGRRGRRARCRGRRGAARARPRRRARRRRCSSARPRRRRAAGARRPAAAAASGA